MANATRRSRTGSSSGFTLLEIVVVLTLLAIILGAVSPVFIHSVRLNRVDQGIRDLIAYLKFAQESAITDACEYRVYLNHEEGTYWVMRMSGRDGDKKLFKRADEPYAGMRRLPSSVEMDRPKAREDEDDHDARFIAFYPNGACDFAQIRLEYGDRGRTVIKTEGSLGTFEIKEKEDD